ncbi:HAMP domain-containing histidine kinase [Listeria monocytogenes]|nr:HAMP domain-containing histidine kinase [Listeria monocytogenes]
MRNRSLVSQFRLNFTWIIIASLLATIITYAFAGMLYIQERNKSIRPANYYEQQIPKIDKYIRKENTKLLSDSEEQNLQNEMEGDGIDYQVVNEENQILYGNNEIKIFNTQKQLFNHLNITSRQQDNFVHVVPIFDNHGNITGAVLLSYKLKLSYENNGLWIVVGIIVALLSPFLYIIGFTWIFSKLFVKNIQYPIELLMDAAQNIKEKNLDFEINYHSENELGKLCNAFSEMKDELQKSLSAQWKMEQERIEMVESLAHDLKTPLSIILGYSESLLESNTEDQEKTYRYLSVIKRNSEKSSELVQRMQYTSDLERNTPKAQLISTNLAKFLKQKIHHYELQAKEKEITIHLKTEGNIQTHFLIDTEKLERILDNIVSNSLQYTPNGGYINISVKIEDHKISYKVCDSGKGFTAKDLEKAFNKFYRGDEARQSKDGNSGLGLYIVKKLVRQIGGSIQIQNEKNGGACIIFTHSKIEDK